MLVLCSLRDCVDVFVYRGTTEDKPMTIYVTVDPERTHPFLASCKSREKKPTTILNHMSIMNIQTSLSLSLYPENTILTCMSVKKPLSIH